MCGMIAEAIISGANPIPMRGPRAVAGFRPAPAHRHVRACRLMMFKIQGSNGGTRATPVRRALGDVASRHAAAVRFEKPNKKPAADFSARVLLFLRRYSYATDLPDESTYFRDVDKLKKMQRNKFDELKHPWAMVGSKQTARGRFPGAGYNFRDDVSMHLICPTSQQKPGTCRPH